MVAGDGDAWAVVAGGGARAVYRGAAGARIGALADVRRAGDRRVLVVRHSDGLGASGGVAAGIRGRPGYRSRPLRIAIGRMVAGDRHAWAVVARGGARAVYRGAAGARIGALA